MSIRLNADWSVVLTSAAGGALAGCLGFFLILRFGRGKKRRTKKWAGQGTKKIKVYHTRTFRSARVAWIVEELGLKDSFEFIDFNPYTAADDELTWYRTHVHPHATVPALVDENTGLVLIESGAICLYLANLHQRLTPDDNDNDLLPVYYDWIVYSVATVDPFLSVLEKNLEKPEEERDAGAMEAAFEKADQFASYFERHLEDKNYICGKSFTAADVVTGYCVMWMSVIKGGRILADYPRVKAYLARLKARPTFAVAMGTPREWVNGPEHKRT